MLSLGNTINKLTVLLISIVLIGSLISGCGETKDVPSLISEAKQYQQDGKEKAAIIQLKNALQQEPRNAEARLLIGTSYIKTGDPVSAEKELNRALDLGMDPDKVLPLLGETLLSLGKFEQVLDKTQQISETNSSARISILRGNALLASGKPEEARTLFEEAVTEESDASDALIGLARHSFSENDIEAAMQYAKQAVSKSPESTAAWLFKADLLRSQGKIDTALAAYDQVIKLESDNVGAHINRAAIKISAKEFDAAKSSIDAAREASPGTLMVVYTQALLDFNQEKYDEALESIQQVLSSAPGHMPSVLLAGAVHYSLGSLLQAEQNLELYLKKDPNNLYARKLMASVLLKSHQAQDAIKVLTPALNASQQDPQLIALAGESYMQAGDFTKATALFEKANTMVPDNAMLHTALGMSMLALGDSEHAITELEKAASLDTKSPRAGIALVMTHLRLKEFDKAMSVIESLEKKQPDNPLFQNLKGGAYIGKEDFTKARASFNKAISLQPNYIPAISNLARLDLLDKKPDAAKNRFETVLKNDKNNIKAMNSLANISIFQEDTKTATKWFELARSRNPDELQPAIQLASYYLRTGKNKESLKLAQTLYGTHSEDLSVVELLAQAQLANDDKLAALNNYKKIAARLPDSAEAQFQLASVHAAVQDLSSSAAALRKALQINPDYLAAQLAQIRLAVQDGNESEALEISRKIQKQHEKLPAGFVLEGDLQMAQKKPALALKAYEQAFSITQNSQLVMKLHSAQSQAGKDNEANARVVRWLTENPDDATVRAYIAGIYLEKRQYDDAAKQYETVIQQHPEHIPTLNNLAWIYQQKKDPRALEYAERAHKHAPDSPAIMDTLGWILIEQGDVARALPLLQKAVSLDPESAELRYHYAVGLEKSGDKANARKELEKLLSTEKTFSQIEEAKNLLKQLQ